MSSIRFGSGREYQFFRREDVRMRWDLRPAVQFLNGFRGDAVAMTAFRRQLGVAGIGPSTAALTDEQVIQSLARMLVAGEFVVAMPQRERQRDTLDLGAPAAAPAAPRERAPTPADVPDDEPTFENDHDGVAQAAVLLAAARAAYPFCEECARHAAMEAAGR
jgi:hypothetical protein